MQRTKHSTQQLLPQRGRSCGARSTLQVCDPVREPPIGAHILTPRRGYTHHGIYVGGGRVVHYRGLSRGLLRGPVEEVSLSQFSQGRPIRMYPADANGADRAEVVRRARLRLGENRYRIFTNNCEHFCEWCTRGEPRSYQVEALRDRYQGIWQRFVLPLIQDGLLRAIRAGADQHREAEAS